MPRYGDGDADKAAARLKALLAKAKRRKADSSELLALTKWALQVVERMPHDDRYHACDRPEDRNGHLLPCFCERRLLLDELNAALTPQTPGNAHA